MPQLIAWYHLILKTDVIMENMEKKFREHNFVPIHTRQGFLVPFSTKQVSHDWLHTFQRKMKAMDVIHPVDFNITKPNTLSKGPSGFGKI